MTSPQPPRRGSHFLIALALVAVAVLAGCAFLGTVTP